MKLKIYSDKNFLPEVDTQTEILFPFWGPHPTAAKFRRYERYIEVGASFFEMTPTLAEADIAVLPADWKHYHQLHKQALAQQFAQQAEQAAKPLVVFFHHDMDTPVPLPYATVFRTSFYRSGKNAREFAMPNWCDDILNTQLEGQLPIHPKDEKPIVGFCGFAVPRTLSWRARLRVPLYHAARLMRRPAQGRLIAPLYGNIRTQALDDLNRHTALKTNFIVREKMFDHLIGTKISAQGRRSDQDTDWQQRETLKDEYAQHMAACDYIVCLRGVGNSSIRFPETLNCGRIPVFVDTDCVLPYEFVVDWRKKFVWVDYLDLPRIGDKVVEFHRSLSPQEFEEKQRECRQLWEEWLSPQGYFANFWRHFQR